MNEKTIGAECAFPTQTDIPRYTGLTKREYFAALCMQGLLSNQKPDLDFSTTYQKRAVRMADLLIKELNKDDNE